MTEIDVGSPAEDRPSTVSGGNTRVLLDNVANESGTLDTIEIWARSDLGNVRVGTFYGSSSNRTCRDFAILGTVSSGSKQTFSGLEINVESGDELGEYWSVGVIEATSTGCSGYLYKYGDQTEAGEQTYGATSGKTFSCYATGETSATNTFAKINGTPWDSVAKICGATKADIAKICGIG